MRILLLNDTSREVGHIGCQLVIQNIRNILRKFGVNDLVCIKDTNANYDYNEFDKILSEIDFVLLNGEGTLHHDAGLGLFKRCEQAHMNGKKVYLINSVWQDNKKTVSYLRLFEKIYVRESYSYKQIIKYSKNNVKIVPDVIFYDVKNYTYSNNKKKLVTDCVLLENTSKLLDLYLNMKNENKFCFMGYWHKNLVKKKFYIRYFIAFFKARNNMKCILDEREFINHSLIITGRFHAVCLAIKYNIPFFTFISNTHKIQGLLNDIGVDEKKYLIDDIAVIKNNLNVSNQFHEDADLFEKYVIKAQVDINDMFKEIIENFNHS